MISEPSSRGSVPSTDAEIVHDPLFVDRVPEAAARQLAMVLAWLAECELATLDRCYEVKSTPASERKRHESICDKLVRHCYELHVQPRGLSFDHCPRLAERLREYESTQKLRAPSGAGAVSGISE